MTTEVLQQEPVEAAPTETKNVEAALPPTSSTSDASAIPREMAVKHPLMYTWVLWYCKAEKGKNWEDCQKEVAKFNTVEDFWALYNHIQLPSGLPILSDYYLFKEGIQPMWEDKDNIKGGRWLLQIDKQNRSEVLDIYWLELLMAIVGEQFDDGSDSICGAVVNVRQKGDKISLWTKDAADEEVNRHIGQVLKQKLGIQYTICYEMHQDSSKKTSSVVRAKLRV